MVWTGIAYWHFFGRLETNHMPLLSDDSAILVCVCRNGSILVHRSLLLPPNTLSGIKISHLRVRPGLCPRPSCGSLQRSLRRHSWLGERGRTEGEGEERKGNRSVPVLLFPPLRVLITTDCSSVPQVLHLFYTGLH